MHQRGRQLNKENIMKRTLLAIALSVAADRRLLAARPDSQNDNKNSYKT